MRDFLNDSPPEYITSSRIDCRDKRHHASLYVSTSQIFFATEHTAENFATEDTEGLNKPGRWAYTAASFFLPQSTRRVF